ncbi:hypothetical protein Tco_0963628, partial [Tanacetum coccineum]
KEEILDVEEETQVKVLMALADDELFVGKNHTRNAKLEAITFQIQNTKLKKLNHALQDQLKEERKVNEKWLNRPKKVKENSSVPASMDYDHEMVPKSKGWVERLNPDRKLPNFNTGRILVLESQAINECLQLTKESVDPESS